MLKHKIYSRLAAILFLLLCSSNVLAQGQYGKLVGKITDANTGEPLIGANVIITGTNIGAATDLDGNYIILRIPPASYSLTASLIGYAKVTMTGVQVIVDRTTEVNFKLTDETIQLQQVVVVAKKPKIIRDQTSTSNTLTQEQIEAAPIEGIRGTLDLTSGFQKSATGNYSIRGSGSYEVNFQINGVEQVNSATNAPGAFGTEKANNSWKYDVNPLGVSQVQLITGGFSPEYGNAQGGVVKVVLKEGSPKLSGDFRVEYRPAGQYHYGTYLYDKSNFEWQQWGTIDNWFKREGQIIKELKLDQRYKWLYERLSVGNPQDSVLWREIVNREISWAYNTWLQNHTPGDDNPLGVYDYRDNAYTRYMVGIGGPLGKDPNLLKFFFSGEYRSNPTRLPTPEKVQVYQNYILNLIFNPMQGHKFKFMGSYQSYRGGIWSGSDDIRWSGLAFTPPGVSTKYYVTTDPVREERTVAQSLNWIFVPTDLSYIEATVSHQYETYQLPYEYLAGTVNQVDRLDSLYDPAGTVLLDGSWWNTEYFRPLINASTNYYQDTRTNHWSINTDYTNQLNKFHQLKAGLRFFYWDMINNGVNSSYQANSYLTRSGFAEYYRAFPVLGAFYIQDKMEYEGIIANFGVRGETYNFQTDIPADKFNPFYQGTNGPGKVGDPATVKSNTKYLLLPRFGLSFPIGESTAFRFQYGHFASMPTFSQALSRRTESGWTGIGNPNLNPKKTIQYEFGLQQVLGENHRLDVALYYNDRASQIGLLRVASFTGSRNRPAGFTNDNQPLYLYTTFDNNTYGATVGIDVTFETITLDRWSYRLSYSLSQTSEGSYGASTVFPDNYRSRETREFSNSYISGSDRTHSFRGLIQYNIKEGEGFEIFGFRPLESTIASLTYTAQSGTPFTYTTVFEKIGTVNNRRYPLESSFDFNLTKNIRFDNYKILIGVRIMNLFNNRWITPMTTKEDLNNWIEQGVTMADPGNDPSRLSYLVAPYRAFRNIPRQIFFTLGFGF